MKKLFALITQFLVVMSVNAQEVLPLYSTAVPNTKVELKVDQMPSLEVYLPAKEKSTRTSVLVIPGGGYGFLAYKEEGTEIAKSFAERGIAAFVLKYRLPSDDNMRDKSIGPLQDAQQALKLIRKGGNEWNLDPKAVGVIGFSAGGHLASTLGTKFNKSSIDNPDNTSFRPDFMILVYPVISMDSKLTHMESRQNLIGSKPTESLIWSFSNEKQVSFDTPPTYLTHAGDDQIVDVNNSIEMYKALISNKVSAELHLYPRGDHGFTQRLPVNEWLDPMLLWLKKEGFYNQPESN